MWYLQSSKPRLKSALKPRRDSGLADTSDADTDCKNTPESNDEDNHKHNNKAKSLLNIVNNNNVNSKPNIQESETKHTKANKKSTPITCDNIIHNTDLYNPDRLNKGKYLEVAFKNDLIFDLDMWDLPYFDLSVF